MANPSKRKGTAGETELRSIFLNMGIELRRTAPGTAWDLESVHFDPELHPLYIVAVRPDRGRWLLSCDLLDWRRQREDPREARRQLRVEVKRYARFALHTIYEEKFGRLR